ncbi:MAG: hypothetical protein J5I94_01260 [Phaeodactylibacter sp.]|nr:hypothetical protein [Phaeodactylibacter sp.]
MPYAYTNRCGETHYFRRVATKKGGFRYYITKDPEAEGLIEEVPEGFEVVEYPYEGRVVIRKKAPVWVSEKEIDIVRQAMERHSPVQDFIITAEEGKIEIHISQFSHYFEGLYPTAEEAKELYSEDVNKWKRYDWIMTFEIMDREKRSFRVVRKASVRYLAVPIDEGKGLEALANKYCYHVGRESLLQFWIPGEDW